MAQMRNVITLSAMADFGGEFTSLKEGKNFNTEIYHKTWKYSVTTQPLKDTDL